VLQSRFPFYLGYYGLKQQLNGKATITDLWDIHLFSPEFTGKWFILWVPWVAFAQAAIMAWKDKI